jgi:hypothetical protein
MVIRREEIIVSSTDDPFRMKSCNDRRASYRFSDTCLSEINVLALKMNTRSLLKSMILLNYQKSQGIPNVPSIIVRGSVRVCSVREKVNVDAEMNS